MKLTNYLTEKNISHAEFARMLGMDSTSAALNVSRYARGLRRPRPAIADKIVAVTKGHVKHKDLYSVESAEERTSALETSHPQFSPSQQSEE